MRRKKYTLFNFCTGDFKGVEQYLNRQAAKGWKLDKVGVLLGRFIWAERDDLRWCVDLADPKREREEEEDYLGLCAEGGWDLAAKTNNMYLFCSRPGLRPAPVQTDPELERKRAEETVQGEATVAGATEGCRFRTRCKFATERCAKEMPELREVEPGHFAACHNLDQVNP